jgi:phosphotransferase system HPr-like phosphotransfer protein
MAFISFRGFYTMTSAIMCNIMEVMSLFVLGVGEGSLVVITTRGSSGTSLLVDIEEVQAV